MDGEQLNQFDRLRQLFAEDPHRIGAEANASAGASGVVTEQTDDNESKDSGETEETEETRAKKRRRRRRQEVAASADLDRQYTLEEQRWDIEQNEEVIERLESKIREVEVQEERRRAEREIKRLQKQQKVRKHNHGFQHKNRGWVTEVSGILGMDSSVELVETDKDGMCHLTARIQTAVSHAVAFLSRLVGKKDATFENLVTEHAFLRLVALFYLKFDTFRAVRHGIRQQVGPSLQHDMDKQMYLLLATKFKLTPGEIQARILGDLNHCSGRPARPCFC